MLHRRGGPPLVGWLKKVAPPRASHLKKLKNVKKQKSKNGPLSGDGTCEPPGADGISSQAVTSSLTEMTVPEQSPPGLPGSPG